MKTARIAALLLLTLATFSHAEPKAAPKVPAFPGEDNYTALRMAFAAQPDFSPYWSIDPDRSAVMDAVRNKDFPKAVALAKTWLEKVPVDAEVHYLCGHFLKKTGDIPGSMHHFHCFYGLMRSITSTGDGKTLKTAWKVISVSEEYALLNEIDAELIDQSLVDNCDKMHVKLPNGTETDFYFDVSISLAATTRQFAPDKK
ncbi:MAG: DUF4919 domain-containing protein [Prosthecobacter sp.]|uniref:DUF4919 domain-containing protein n=1 Tax=Prosthecobacter sp. TaxID=1965333 RepID=UPI00260AFA54|nr:DUF4919 domain-containing protein [Prosthecobacter sp.]MCF7790118.1 DUF4919 domain-containing protein [Prosthecobacter sp.]